MSFQLLLIQYLVGQPFIRTTSWNLRSILPIQFSASSTVSSSHILKICSINSTFESWKTSVDQSADGSVTSRAEVSIRAKGELISSSGSGNGPVNAIDRALRNGLEKLYPELAQLELTDYKVRILEGRLGTGAITRVLVESSDGHGEWSTIGVHENVIAASAMALEDALTYGLIRAGKKPE